jgi:hypothetical protein
MMSLKNYLKNTIMTTRLFDIENGEIIATEHCYALNFLKAIMDNYPDNYLNIYKYLFYMSCPNPDFNPYFHMSEVDKEEVILKDVEADFSADDDLIIVALGKCNKMYETPTSRAYKGLKSMLDKLAVYMENTPITHGRDGNINSLVAAAKNFDGIRASFKGAYKDLKEEQQSHVRGGAGLAYDQI